MQARNFLLVVFFGSSSCGRKWFKKFQLELRVRIYHRENTINVVASIPCPDGVLNYITYKLAIKVGFCLRQQLFSISLRNGTYGDGEITARVSPCVDSLCLSFVPTLVAIPMDCQRIIMASQLLRNSKYVTQCLKLVPGSFQGLFGFRLAAGT